MRRRNGLHEAPPRGAFKCAEEDSNLHPVKPGPGPQPRHYLFPPLEREALEESARQEDTEAVKARIVCDYIARLTEARALELHQRLLGTTIPLLPLASH